MPQIGRRTLRTRERLRRLEEEGGSITDLGPALGQELEKQIEERWEQLRLRMDWISREDHRKQCIAALSEGYRWKDIVKEDLDGF